MTRILQLAAILTAIAMAACGRPGEQGLRDSFAQQMAANRFVEDFQRSGDELTFSGPGPEGGVAKWRVHIDSAVIESNADGALPYKGTVKSSWYSDGQRIDPSGAESNLPFELISKGLSQDCWAFWDKAAGEWSWESESGRTETVGAGAESRTVSLGSVMPQKDRTRALT